MKKLFISLSVSLTVLFLLPCLFSELVSPHGGMVFCIFLLYLVNPLYFAALGAYSGLDFKKRWWNILAGLLFCFFFLQFVLEMDEAMLLYLGGYGIIGIALLLLVAWVLSWNRVEANELVIYNTALPANFDGFRIAQISDLHNVTYGKENEPLLSLLKSAKADMIVITGDFIDSRNTKPGISLKLARELVKLAPVYYIPGNHESRVTEYNDLKQGLEQLGVQVLENQRVELKKGTDSITVIGLQDPGFFKKYKKEEETLYFSEQLKNDRAGYRMLLVHRPEYFDIYAGKADLVFCGHAHGGQFILPLVGGLIAPGQGLFPKYYRGVYHKNGTDMVVSRGAGYTVLPLRINNPPEIVVVTVKKGRAN